MARPVVRSATYSVKGRRQAYRKLLQGCGPGIGRTRRGGETRRMPPGRHAEQTPRRRGPAPQGGARGAAEELHQGSAPGSGHSDALAPCGSASADVH